MATSTQKKIVASKKKHGAVEQKKTSPQHLSCRDSKSKPSATNKKTSSNRTDTLNSLRKQTHHYVTGKKMKNASQRLKELEQEKKKLEEMIQLLQKQSQGGNDDEGSNSEDDDSTSRLSSGGWSVGSSSSSSASSRSNYHHRDDPPRKRKSRQGTSRRLNLVRVASDISSLPSQAGASIYQQTHDNNHLEQNNGNLEYDDVSIMTENIYHYDNTGRRKSDDDYHFMDDNATTAAYYQNLTGKDDLFEVTRHDKSRPNDQAPAKNKNHNIAQQLSKPVVTIEWARGKSYRPEANLEYNDDIHQVPADLSLFVKDDLSAYDDLSFSSGDDSKLAAAAPDMPVFIDLTATMIEKSSNNNHTDEDNLTVNSALHSECSVSVMAGPILTQSRQQQRQHRPNSSNQQTLAQSGEAPVPQLFSQLYISNQSDDSQSNGLLEDVDDSKPPKRRSQRKQKTSLQRGAKQYERKQQSPLANEAKTSGNRSGQHMPVQEISISELSMDSLGSDVCGVSVTLSEQPPRSPVSPKNSSSKTRESRATKNAKKSKAISPTSQTQDSGMKQVQKIHNNRNRAKAGYIDSKHNNSMDSFMLGDRDSETEENELSAGDLDIVEKKPRGDLARQTESKNRWPVDLSPNRRARQQSSNTRKHISQGKRSETTSTDMSYQNSESTLGGATGVDTEACVAAPRRSSMPVKPTKNGAGEIPSLRKSATLDSTNSPKSSEHKLKAISPKRPTSRKKTSSPSGMKKDSGNGNLSAQASNSNLTCNSSLTSIPGVLDSSTKSFVIEGTAAVK